MNTGEKQPLIYALPPDLLRVVLAHLPELERHGIYAVGNKLHTRPQWLNTSSTEAQHRVSLAGDVWSLSLVGISPPQRETQRYGGPFASTRMPKHAVSTADACGRGCRHGQILYRSWSSGKVLLTTRVGMHRFCTACSEWDVTCLRCSAAAARMSTSVSALGADSGARQRGCLLAALQIFCSLLLRRLVCITSISV